MPDSSLQLSVLHISSWYPSRMSLQNGNFVQRHIEAISKYTHGHVLHVVSDPNVDTWDVIERSTDSHKEVIVTYPRGNWISRYRRNIKAHRLGYQKLAAHTTNIDLIHVHVMYPAIAYAAQLSLEISVPIVVTEHATAYHQDHPGTYAWWQRWFLKKYSKTVLSYFPVSQDLQVSMERKGIRGRYQVIPNVVDTDLFIPDQDIESSDTFEYIHISSLKDEHKNVSGLLSVFSEVVRAHPQARLTIIGNDHHAQIQRYIDLLKLSSQVTLLRELPITEVAQYLRRAQALLLFSNYENAPCVISEAHCVGLPVIATDVGGVSEMINERNGLLVDKGDAYGLYAAMSRLIETYDQYDATAIHQAGTQRYAYDVVGKQYLEAYIDLLQ